MTPTETLARLLEESGAQIVLPNETVREAFAALEAEVAATKAAHEQTRANYSKSMQTANSDIEQLQAEITRLTRERDYFQAEWQTAVRHKHEIAALRDAARADRERLDWWMTKGAQWSMGKDFKWQNGEQITLYQAIMPHGFKLPLRLTFREAIDDARKAGA